MQSDDKRTKLSRYVFVTLSKTAAALQIICKQAFCAATSAGKVELAAEATSHIMQI